MKISNPLSRITAYLHGNISKDVLNDLKEVGVRHLHVFPARSLVIEVRRGLLSLLPGRDLARDPIDTIFFLTSPDKEEALINFIINKGHLHSPGRGSVLAEEITLIEADDPEKDQVKNQGGFEQKDQLKNEGQRLKPFDIKPPSVHLQPYAGICCIMKRGQSESVARLLLDTGTSVPVIHFGTGTGVRDKMGLLRITIPAEKEIIHAFTTHHEIENIMDMMIDAGRLNQPGSGFIYTYPVKKGLINIKVRRGEQRNAASIEQIINTLDHIQGNTAWRRKKTMQETKKGGRKRYITNLVEMMLLCNAGMGVRLVKEAISAGAGGATISDVKQVRPPEAALKEVSPAREACSMVIPENMKDVVTRALENAGAFTDRCHGQVHVRRPSKAFTYTRF